MSLRPSDEWTIPKETVRLARKAIRKPITVVQFAEGLTDRETADAVRSRIDLKYLLGFDSSVLSEFRRRLVDGSVEHRLLDDLLQRLKANGALKAMRQQRTDSTHVLDSVRTLNRLELLGETVRAALNTVAGIVPEWLRSQVPAVWFDRAFCRVTECKGLTQDSPAGSFDSMVLGFRNRAHSNQRRFVCQHQPINSAPMR